MKEKLRKGISILLVCCMIPSILPLTASAEEAQIEPFNVTVTTETADQVSVQPLVDVTVVNHTQLLNAINGAAPGVPRTIALGASFTMSGQITISGNRRITLTSVNTRQTLAAAINATTAQRHFVVTDAGSSLTLQNIELDGAWNQASDISRGGVVVQTNASLRLENGSVIRGCRWGTRHTGAGVHVASGGRVTMTGTALIRGNTVEGGVSNHSGGGVFLTGVSSTFEMTGGVIEANRATSTYITAADAGGVRVLNGSFTMSNAAVIRGNIVAGGGSAGGVHVSGGGNFAMSGSALIYNNEVAHSNSAGGALISSAASTFTMMGTAVIDGNTATGQSSAGGVRVISGRVTMSGATFIRNNTVSGINSSGGVLVASYWGQPRGVFEMTSGVIENNNVSGSSSSGGVRVTGSRFAMSGTARIYDNTATGNSSAGGVKMSASSGQGVINSGIFEMTGGMIEENRALGSNSSGGVRIAGTGSNLAMSNAATIHGNTATGNNSAGGVILTIATNTLTMTGGRISGNNGATGGGVRLSSGSFTMTGGTVEYNTATTDGGGIWVGNVENALTVTNGTIRNNTAGRNGGGIFASNYSSLTISNAVRFSGNSAAAQHDFGAANRGADITVTDGGSGNPRNIDWATVSLPNTHALNNYDINFIPRAPVQRTVTFNLHGGTGDFPPQTVPNGGTATAPTAIPTRAGYGFVGWFTAQTGGAPFDFAAPITANTVIHARWGAVDFVNSIHYVIGTDMGTIEPHAPITRGSVATVLRRVMEHETRVTFWTLENPFHDVPNNGGRWYSNAVSVVGASRLMLGMPGDMFGANQSMTRAEMAVLALRVHNMLLTSPAADARNINFYDVPADHWAYAQISQAAALGLMQGAGDGYFRPDAHISRAEFASLMNRLINRTVADIDVNNMIEWVDNPYGTWYYWALQVASNPTPGVPPMNWAALQRPYATPNCVFQP